MCATTGSRCLVLTQVSPELPDRLPRILLHAFTFPKGWMIPLISLKFYLWFYNQFKIWMCPTHNQKTRIKLTTSASDILIAQIKACLRGMQTVVSLQNADFNDTTAVCKDNRVSKACYLLSMLRSTAKAPAGCFLLDEGVMWYVPGKSAKATSSRDLLNKRLEWLCHHFQTSQYLLVQTKTQLLSLKKKKNRACSVSKLLLFSGSKTWE